MNKHVNYQSLKNNREGKVERVNIEEAPLESSSMKTTVFTNYSQQ